MISGAENSKRIEKSLAGEKLDRHAFHFFADAPFLCSVAQVPLSEYYNDYNLMMDVQINVYDQMGKNGLVSPEYGAVMECSGYNAKIHRDAIGIMSAYPIGINELSDVSKIKSVNLFGDNMMAKSLEALAYMKNHVPAGYEVNPCRIMAPFTVSASLRGISDFCVDLHENEDLVFALLDMTLENAINYAKEVEKILGKLDYLMLADDISAFVSPSMFEKYVLPTYVKFYAEFPNVSRWLHNDADAAHIAKGIAKAKFELWHVGYCIDMDKAYEDTEGKVSLVGNLPPVQSLLNGNPDSVKDDVNKLLDKFEGNSKFIMGGGGFLSYGTPIDNVNQAIRTVLERPIN